MKFGAAILLCHIIFFFVQPVFATVHSNEAATEHCCPESNKEKKSCPENCNPLFMCMYCQYLPAKTIKITKCELLMPIEHHAAVKANIFTGFVALCWHPPDE